MEERSGQASLTRYERGQYIVRTNELDVPKRAGSMPNGEEVRTSELDTL
jgi:hypothetical protein